MVKNSTTQENNDNEDLTHTKKISTMFSEITNRYDILNHVLSMGLDFWWRYKLVSSLSTGNSSNPKKALDMAAGTLDISLALIKHYKNLHVTAGDICEPMMLYGEKKIPIANKNRITIQVMDAQNIPFPDNSFDITTMAFGIRNVENRIQALKEMHRTLVSGGKLGILEFSPLRTPVIGRLYHFYLEKCTPKIASLFGEKTSAYTYLAESIKLFPSPTLFCKELEESGFEFIQYKPLNFGIANLYVASKS